MSWGGQNPVHVVVLNGILRDQLLDRLGENVQRLSRSSGQREESIVIVTSGPRVDGWAGVSELALVRGHLGSLCWDCQQAHRIPAELPRTVPILEPVETYLRKVMWECEPAGPLLSAIAPPSRSPVNLFRFPVDLE